MPAEQAIYLGLEAMQVACDSDISAMAEIWGPDDNVG